MKIGLSKKSEGTSRHITMVLPITEERAVRAAVYNDVLGREFKPVRETFSKRGDDGVPEMWVRYRFAMRFLEDVTLTFPYADFSPGLESMLNEAVRAQIAAIKTPKIKIPGFKAKLYKFQKYSVDMMVRKYLPNYPSTKDVKKKIIFALNDELGLGKTIQILAFLCATQRFPAIIVVPNSLKFNWRNEIEKFTDLDCVVLHGSNAERAEMLQQPADIYITNPESLRTKRIEVGEDDDGHPIYEYEHRLPSMFDRKFTLAVVDEYHNFKNPDAQQSIGLHHLKAKNKIVMSGTPMLNGKPEELWSVLHWLYPKKYDDYGSFVRRYCVKKGSKTVSYRHLKELKRFLYGGGITDREARSLRRRKDHIAEQLPDVVEYERMIELNPEQRRLYNQINDEALLWIEENPRQIFNALAQITRLKQAAFSPELYGGSQSSAKMDELKEIVKELVSSGEKAIIFSQWKTSVEIMQRELAQYDPAVVTGDVPVQTGSTKRGTLKTPRQDQIDKFNNDDDCKVFIGTIGSCREGFSLPAGNYVITTDKDWVPSKNKQAIGRSPAGGLRGVGVKRVTVIHLIAKDTIEEDIELLLKKKQKMNDRMTEMDAGAFTNTVTATEMRALFRRY